MDIVKIGEMNFQILDEFGTVEEKQKTYDTLLTLSKMPSFVKAFTGVDVESDGHDILIRVSSVVDSSNSATKDPAQISYNLNKQTNKLSLAKNEHGNIVGRNFIYLNPAKIDQLRELTPGGFTETSLVEALTNELGNFVNVVNPNYVTAKPNDPFNSNHELNPFFTPSEFEQIDPFFNEAAEVSSIRFENIMKRLLDKPERLLFEASGDLNGIVGANPGNQPVFLSDEELLKLVAKDVLQQATPGAKITFQDIALNLPPGLSWSQKFQIYDRYLGQVLDMAKSILVNYPIDFVKVVFSLAKKEASPLVLDLDGDGVEVSKVGEVGSVYFDLNHDGYAEETGFVRGGDGILAIDLNSDGVINDGTEIFGDQTGSSNGFSLLGTYDSNHDHKITTADSQFSNLKVWIESNQDGYLQFNELFTLPELGITSIDLAYTEVNQENNGNSVKQASTFTINGATHAIQDVYFAAS